jgi:predicted nucleic acid-binding protein
VFLDTSVCVDLLREQARGRTDGPATRKLRGLGSTPLYLSLFVACELHAGARLASHPAAEIRNVERFMELAEIVLPDRTFAVAYGESEAALRRKGTPIPVMDLMIGTLAKIHGMPLLVRKEQHFKLIPGLVVEEYCS